MRNRGCVEPGPRCCPQPAFHCSGSGGPSEQPLQRSLQAAHRLLPRLLDGEEDVEALARESGLEQISEPGMLEPWIEDVLKRCSSMVEEYRGGKKVTLNALVGRVMRASKGKADPIMVRKLLIQKIEEE
ncbi:MAG: GatB/YqeY domain-containing protein [Planctomycetota bacterium]